MNRLYAIESMPTSTGSRADHRLALRPSEIEGVARRLAATVGVADVDRGDGAATAKATEKVVAAIAKDLLAHRGRSLVLVGDGQPPLVHALAHEIGALIPVSVRVTPDICASLPCVLGPEGPSEPLMPPMTERERADWAHTLEVLAEANQALPN